MNINYCANEQCSEYEQCAVKPSECALYRPKRVLGDFLLNKNGKGCNGAILEPCTKNGKDREEAKEQQEPMSDAVSGQLQAAQARAEIAERALKLACEYFTCTTVLSECKQCSSHEDMDDKRPRCVELLCNLFTDEARKMITDEWRKTRSS